MRPELQPILDAARSLQPEELPRLLGDLEEVKATALARLTSHQQQHCPDSLLSVDEAAGRLGISPAYLYRNHQHFSFTRRMGRSLRFSANGIDHYISQQYTKTPRRRYAILSSVR